MTYQESLQNQKKQLETLLEKTNGIITRASIIEELGSINRILADYEQY